MLHLNVTAASVRNVLVRKVSPDIILYTDSSRLYTRIGSVRLEEKQTNHTKREYVRYEGEEVIHSNTIEGVFSVFRRGMIGVYRGAAGKRLTYVQTDNAYHA
ncbi:MAG: transposase [Rhizobiaceae bacterium]|nr:MAG: transposase [Rhizobiaceae bacterium]CAG0998403.1 hypothetical protein RHIZO_02664 [Rhizobiaceae bacterium]